jgi:hypothetical protein
VVKIDCDRDVRSSFVYKVVATVILIVMHHHNVAQLGDFNSRSPSWSDAVTSPTATAIEDFLDDVDMHTLNDRFVHGRWTRRSPRPGEAGSVIDLAITNKPDLVHDFTISKEYGLRSDHHPIQLDITLSPDNPINGSSAHLLSAHRIQWLIKNVNWDVFKRFSANVFEH